MTAEKIRTAFCWTPVPRIQEGRRICKSWLPTAPGTVFCSLTVSVFFFLSDLTKVLRVELCNLTPSDPLFRKCRNLLPKHGREMIWFPQFNPADLWVIAAECLAHGTEYCCLLWQLLSVCMGLSHSPGFSPEKSSSSTGFTSSLLFLVEGLVSSSHILSTALSWAMCTSYFWFLVERLVFCSQILSTALSFAMWTF